ncbi:MAG: hypothetical protein LBB09_01345 [Rickettsiales bacterium]|jgi:hypothetical protein|nr:hypothetical protein [Rickettsiales bacterium]
MMHFNVLYHFFILHRRIIFAKTATGVMDKGRGATRAKLVEQGLEGFLEVAYI